MLCFIASLVVKKFNEKKNPDKTIKIIPVNNSFNIISIIPQTKIIIEEIRTDKISLEEYYINLMNSKEGK